MRRVIVVVALLALSLVQFQLGSKFITAEADRRSRLPIQIPIHTVFDLAKTCEALVTLGSSSPDAQARKIAEVALDYRSKTKSGTHSLWQAVAHVCRGSEGADFQACLVPDQGGPGWEKAVRFRHLALVLAPWIVLFAWGGSHLAWRRLGWRWGLPGVGNGQVVVLAFAIVATTLGETVMTIYSAHSLMVSAAVSPRDLLLSHQASLLCAWWALLFCGIWNARTIWAAREGRFSIAQVVGLGGFFALALMGIVAGRFLKSQAMMGGVRPSNLLPFVFPIAMASVAMWAYSQLRMQGGDVFHPLRGFFRRGMAMVGTKWPLAAAVGAWALFPVEKVRDRGPLIPLLWVGCALSLAITLREPKDTRSLRTMWTVLPLCALALGVAAPFLAHNGLVSERLAAFWYPGDTDQVMRCLWHLAAGGFWGQAAGADLDPALINAHKDFYPVILVAVHGVAGIICYIAALLAVVWTALRRSEARDAFREPQAQGLLCLAVVVHLLAGATQSLAGSAVLYPASGVPLPGVSFGGQSLLAIYASLGLLSACVAPALADAIIRPWPGWRIGVGLVSCLVLLTGIGILSYLPKRRVILSSLVRHKDGTVAVQPALDETARKLFGGDVLDREGVKLVTSGPICRRMEVEDGFTRVIGTPDSPVLPRRGTLETEAWPVLTGTIPQMMDRRLEDNKIRIWNVLVPRTVTLHSSGRAKTLLDIAEGRLSPAPSDIRCTLSQATNARILKACESTFRREIPGGNFEDSVARVVALDSHGELLAFRDFSDDWKGDAEGATFSQALFGKERPGSILKPFVLWVALQQPGLVGSFVCSERGYTLPDGRHVPTHCKSRVGGRKVVKAHGRLPSAKEAMKISCSSYFSHLAMVLGPEHLSAGLSRLGIDVSAKDLNLPGALQRSGFGEGVVAVSAYQMARGLAHLIDAAGMAPGKPAADQWRYENPHWVMTPPLPMDWSSAERKAARQVLETMHAPLEPGGTAAALQAFPLVCAKTGTAEAAGGGFNAWFLALLQEPGAEPIVLCIEVPQPRDRSHPNTGSNRPVQFIKHFLKKQPIN